MSWSQFIFIQFSSDWEREWLDNFKLQTSQVYAPILSLLYILHAWEQNFYILNVNSSHVMTVFQHTEILATL